MKRLVIACVLTIGLGWKAHAEDPRIFAPTGLFPVTPSYWNWSGFYFGGVFGMTSGNFDPQNATGPMVAHLLRDTTIENEAGISHLPQLPSVSTGGTSYGAFVGFNRQWDDIILGLELNYNFGRLSAHSSDSVGRSYVASDGYLYDVFLNSHGSIALKDYGTIRARAGYVMDRFLPYAQFGAAIGRADLRRSVTVNLTGVDADPATPPVLPPVALNAALSEFKKDAFIYGFSAGVGLDIALMENVFLRAEYEFIQFFPAKSMLFSMHTGRVGAAVKF
jgi:opacity protein-like surface antigen